MADRATSARKRVSLAHLSPLVDEPPVEPPDEPPDDPPDDEPPDDELPEDDPPEDEPPEDELPEDEPDDAAPVEGAAGFAPSDFVSPLADDNEAALSFAPDRWSFLPSLP